MQRRSRLCYPGAFRCKMACAQLYLMQETNPSFPFSVGFYLFSAPLTKLNLQSKDLDDAAKTLVRGAAKEGMKLEL